MEYQIVAAIDFGTTFSGYAYSHVSKKDAIYVNKNWGQDQGFQSQKTPTCLLLNPDGQFEAFGYEALSRYNDLPEDEAEEYYLFDRFKMKLYDNKDLNTETAIQDVTGKVLWAVHVFSCSLYFMKNHMLQAIKVHMGYDPDPDTVRWVLTVPAIWDENAKQFMREAAFRGGLIPKTNSENLLVALEPEAASLYCRNLAILDVKAYKNIAFNPSFEAGTKYLLVDAGGGTIDCVAHEIQKDGRVRELFRATGGPWGGTVVDQQFVDLLYRIFGKEFITEFQKEYPKDYVELLQDFEIKKRGEHDNIRVTLPYIFCRFNHEGVHVHQAVENYCLHQTSNVKFSSGKLVLQSSAVTSLFSEVLCQIKHHVEDLTRKPELRNFEYILLVGGFAESSRLQECLKTHADDRVRCLVPDEASLAVVRGAVAFGHDPSSIRERICRFTYGVDVCKDFEEGIHREDHKFIYEGETNCNHIFETWAKEGDTIGYNEVWRATYNPLRSNQTSIKFKFFKSSRRYVEYTDDEVVEKFGSLKVNMPDLTGGKERIVELEVTFGGTEIKVVGHDKTTSKKYETVIDFLSSY